jgi:hypothetical protein
MVLYPREHFIFFSESGSVEAIQQLPEQFDGVGTIPLNPEESDRAGLRAVLNGLLARSS